MIHRYRINRNKVLGENYSITSATTVTWLSGNTTASNTVTYNQNINLKNIVIPVELKFEPMDYSDIIDRWVDYETQKVINRIQDGETVRFINTNLTLDFRFLDRSNWKYPANLSYSHVGFDLPDDFHLKRFKKSFFRLYFYDGNTGETRNLLFVEDLPVEDGIKNPNFGGGYSPTFKLSRLYWEKDDEIMFNTTNDRTVYMEARFFNAKTGNIHKFINIPIGYNSNNQITITDYNNPNNRGWRTSPILLLNPNGQQGNYRFLPLNNVGANTFNKITLSEFVIK